MWYIYVIYQHRVSSNFAAASPIVSVLQCFLFPIQRRRVTKRPVTIGHLDVIQAESRCPWHLRLVLPACTSFCHDTLGKVLVLQGITLPAEKTGDEQRAMNWIEYRVAGKRGLLLPPIEKKGE